MTIDLGAAYRASRLRVAALVDDSRAAQPVPATPEWNAHDVVAHLAGVMNDIVSGNMEGVTTKPWTAAQVERGRDKTVARLIDEWSAGAEDFEAFLSSPAGARAGLCVVDVHAHETDLRVAFGLEPDVPAEVAAWVGELMREDFDSRVASAGLPGVKIDVSDFELFRARLGRRTREQVSAFGWSADPAPYLDEFFLFGPTEQPVGP
jgi:uncharacterized protein (TIGR03083 family)